MTLILELSPEMEARLTAEAVKQGLTLSQYALQKLIASSENPTEKTASDKYSEEWSEEDLHDFTAESWNYHEAAC